VTRVLIVADSINRGRRIASLLQAEEQIQVLEPVTIAALDEHPTFADIIIAAGLSTDQLPHASIPLVVLAEATETAAWGQNVRAWLPLNALPSEIVAAAIAAASELTVLTTGQARRWLPGVEPGRAPRNGFVEALTARELQVLRMLAEGLANKEIAERLGISDHTAKFHVAQILAKLGAGSRAEAVAAGIRRGLVPI
jgi:DNA-binding NarL/FixJ family response regulator